jgi:hypothetical protein
MGLGHLEEAPKKNSGTVIQEMLNYKCTDATEYDILWGNLGHDCLDLERNLEEFIDLECEIECTI